MMKLTTTRNGRTVACFCDSCGKRIANIGMAVVVVGPDERALFAHKGACHTALEEQSPQDGFIELREVLSQVTASC
jgi:hypothetical protein